MITLLNPPIFLTLGRCLVRTGQHTATVTLHNGDIPIDAIRKMVEQHVQDESLHKSITAELAELMAVQTALLPADLYNPISPNLLEARSLAESQSEREPEPEPTIRKKTKQQLELEAMRRVRTDAARAAEGQTMHVLNESTSSDSASTCSDSSERGDTEGLNFGETSESLGQPGPEPESQPQGFQLCGRATRAA